MISMYSSVNCSVKLEKGSTPFFKSHVGVKQGCNLSPTLFNMFINDTPNLFSGSCAPVKLGKTELNCLLYADDLIWLSESKSRLQNCLTKLGFYTKRWKLNINLKKSKVLLFGTPTQKHAHLSSNWSFNNIALEQVDEYCYLGITLHFSGNFKRTQKILYGKAIRAYHCLFKSYSNMENVPIKLLLKLFSSNKHTLCKIKIIHTRTTVKWTSLYCRRQFLKIPQFFIQISSAWITSGKHLSSILII